MAGPGPRTPLRDGGRIALFVNSRVGAVAAGAVTLEALRSAFAGHGVYVDACQVQGCDVQARIRWALRRAPPDAVVVCGGDGTVSAAAGVIAGSDRPLGVIAAGTLNHFARDLGVPPVLEQAVALIAAGAPRPVDVAEVNAQVFVNNASVGIYSTLVRVRRRVQRRLKARRLAMMVAGLAVLRRPPRFQVQLHVGRKCINQSTPFVLVGNNEYAFDLFNLGARRSLRGGTLSLYTADERTRGGMLRLLLAALSNRLEEQEGFRLHLTEQVLLHMPKPRIRVVVDGEVAVMHAPLCFRIRPGALLTYLPDREPDW